jgi:hypothetical protein
MSNLESRGWAAMLFPAGPAVAEVTGALRGSRRLHWTMRAAQQEAEGWVDEMKLEPIRWEVIDDQCVIGRSNDAHTVVLRSVLLPEGAAPPLRPLPSVRADTLAAVRRRI